METGTLKSLKGETMANRNSEKLPVPADVLFDIAEAKKLVAERQRETFGLRAEILGSRIKLAHMRSEFLVRHAGSPQHRKG